MDDPAGTIREAVVSDASAVSRMWTKMAAQHRGYDAECWDWSADCGEVFAEHFQQMCRNEDAVLLVGVDASDTPIAYLVAVCVDAPEIFSVRRKGRVYDLFVEPDWRGRGLGRRMMNRAFAALKDRGAEEVDLQVAGDNAAATGFYESLGMRNVAVRMYKRL
jgi:ribosomal protein S18 acetylase RimI-like enzyme